MTEFFRSQIYNPDILASAGLLLFLLALWLLAGRWIKSRDNLPDVVVRRWTANVRNLLLIVALIGLIMIWAPQLRTFALSLTAVAIALVVATKELILCLSGSALRTFTRAYSVGDYVHVGTSRGEVIDYNLLATRLNELEQRDGSFVPTGRKIVLPHSLLFGGAVRAQSQTEGRVPHSFRLTFEPNRNLFSEQAKLQEIADAAQKSVEETAAAPKKKRTAKPVAPLALIQFGTSEIGKYRIDVTATAVPELVIETENAIACAIGDHVHRMEITAPKGTNPQ